MSMMASGSGSDGFNVIYEGFVDDKDAAAGYPETALDKTGEVFYRIFLSGKITAYENNIIISLQCKKTIKHFLGKRYIFQPFLGNVIQYFRKM